MDATLRVGFDALFFEQPMTGSGQYATQLWPRLSTAYPGLEMVAIGPSDAPPAVSELAGPRLRQTRIPNLPRRLRKLYWEQIGQVRVTAPAGLHLMHVPYWAAPVVQRVPYVVTVHDVIPLALPAYRGSAAMRGYLSLVSRAARRARLILTDSEHARSDIIARLGVPADSVLAIPLAAGDHYQPPRDGEGATSEAALRANFGVDKPFVFNVGGFDVRKRLDVLVEGFALALPQLQDDVELVIAGSPHTGNPRLYPPLEPLLRRFGLTNRVRMLGFVSEDDKRALFWAAEVYAFTSEYEGFGLSPLEAMACGAAVICSNRTSLPEVVGDAGVLVDPTAHSVAAALVRVLNDAPLRDRLVAAGLARAGTFSWERTADATVAAYRRAACDATPSTP